MVSSNQDQNKILTPQVSDYIKCNLFICKPNFKCSLTLFLSKGHNHWWAKTCLSHTGDSVKRNCISSQTQIPEWGRFLLHLSFTKNLIPHNFIFPFFFHFLSSLFLLFIFNSKSFNSKTKKAMYYKPLCSQWGLKPFLTSQCSCSR